MASLEQRYAQALDGVVTSGKADADAVGRELSGLAETFEQSPALRAVLASPAVSWEKKRRLLDAVAGRAGLSRLAHNFLLVVVERGRAAWLPAIHRAFDEMQLEREGIVRSEIVSARELGAAERTALERALGARLGRTLRASYRRDPELIGGFRARVGDEVFDGSVRGRLERLRQALLEA